jgi:hypothetical protein
MSSIIARKRTQPKTKRVCSECERMASSGGHWYRDGKGGWLCKNCYQRFYFRECASLFSYKGKLFWDKQKRRLRSGICALYGARRGNINPNTGKPIQTHRAHIEYHEDEPLKDTIELCATCHRKYDHGVPPDRTCCICGSNRTYMRERDGYEDLYPCWFRGPLEGQFMCQNCYRKKERRTTM